MPSSSKVSAFGVSKTATNALLRIRTEHNVTTGIRRMNEYIIFMFNDAVDQQRENDGKLWTTYIKTLRESGNFDGGSSIGSGEKLKNGKSPEPATLPITGFIRIRATNFDEAKLLLAGNPSYEAGCYIEIRELPQE